MGWRNFFQMCFCVSFLVVAGNSFRCYLPTMPIVLLCFLLVAAGYSFGLHRSVFQLWREIVLGVTYLSTIPVVSLCQLFWLRREIVFGCTVYKKVLICFFFNRERIRQQMCVICKMKLSFYSVSLYSVSISCTVKIHRLTDQIVS